jgi:hypothetical protein
MHAAPAQQVSPAPPHAAHTPPVHARAGSPHVFPAQHASPAPPHATHVFEAASHVAPLAVHAPLQHAAPIPPHVPQLPLLHVPPRPGHAEPLAMHMFASQQPLLSQLAPAQHGWPGPPHCWQTPPTHAPAEHGGLAAQQAVPSAPHVGSPASASLAASTPTPPASEPASPHPIVGVHVVMLHEDWHVWQLLLGFSAPLA